MRPPRPAALLIATALVAVGGAAAQSACGPSITVRAGDTLGAIAERCGTTVEALRQANPTVEPRRLAVGQSLSLPTASPAQRHPEADRRYGARDRLDSARRQGAEHVVGYGEDLPAIAARYGTTVEALRLSNPGLPAEGVRQGQVLTVPGLHDEMPRADADPAARVGPPRVEVSPRQAAPGAEVRVTAWGLPPDTEMVIGAGPSDSDWRTLKTVTSTSRGRVEDSIRLPEAAAGAEQMIIVLAAADRGPAASAPIELTAADVGPGAAPVVVTGTLSNEGVECPALRADDGTLYTLAGGAKGFTPGARVRVTGRPVDASVCMQGRTLSVEEIADASR